MKKPHEEWFYMAGEDLRFAASGMKDGFYAHVCGLSQQAAEKAMKGYLVFSGKDYPKSHDLPALCRLMDVDWLDDYLGALKKLSQFYVPLRYPDAIAGSLPEGLPGEKEARQAIKWAQEIVELIQKNC